MELLLSKVKKVNEIDDVNDALPVLGLFEVPKGSFGATYDLVN